MENLSIIELYQIKSCLIKESMTNEPIWEELLLEIKRLEEKIFNESDTSATGGPFIGGGGMSGNPVDLGKTPLGPNGLLAQLTIKVILLFLIIRAALIE